METASVLYTYFISALRHTVDEIGWGAIKQVADKAMVSSSLVSQILSAKRPKGANEKLQRKIALACGAESLEDFLEKGKILQTECNDMVESEPDTQRNSNMVQDDNKQLLDTLAQVIETQARRIESDTKEIDYLRRQIKTLKGGTPLKKGVS